MDIKKAMGLIFGLAIIAMGIFAYKYDAVDSPYKEALLILFVVYGVWRLYRAYKF